LLLTLGMTNAGGLPLRGEPNQTRRRPGTATAGQQAQGQLPLADHIWVNVLASQPRLILELNLNGL